MQGAISDVPRLRCRDEARAHYYKQVRGYIKERVQPAIEALRETPEGMPAHLEKVQ